MTGISGSPFNGQYGAGKAYILKLTEAVAYETKKTGVDVEAITLGTTLTPTAMKNFPKGPAGDAVVKIALTPTRSPTRRSRSSAMRCRLSPASATRTACTTGRPTTWRTKYIAYMGAFYEN